MIRGCAILVLLLALPGCNLDPDEAVAPEGPPRLGRLATTNERMTRLKMDIGERDLRIRELEDHVERLSKKLQQAEFLNEQLRRQLAAVGDAPSQRDHYKQLLAEQGVELQRIERKVEQLERHLATLRAPTTQASP